MAREDNSLAVLLRITAFRRMWLALSTSSMGDWLGLLATTALAAYLTRDASNLAQGAAVSGVLVTRLAPDLILGPVAGALVDRLDRRYVAIIGDSCAGLLYLSIPFAGNLVWLLIAQFLVEAIGLFSNPAKQALWVNIVPRERLAVANQLNYVSVYGMVPVAAAFFAVLATVAQLFGAPTIPEAETATALISVTSSAAINIALVIDAASYFVAAIVLFVTRHQIPAYLDDNPAQKSVFFLVKEGIGYVKNSSVMRAIYVGILGAFAAGGLVAGVAQAYVATMGGGNAGYGIMFGTVFSGIALGMLIGPKVLPAVPRRMVFTMGIGVAGLALLAMSLIQDFVGAAIMSVVMGLFAGIAWITGFTMIGHEVADRLRGRVFAFVMSSVRVMLLGTIAVGPILANGIGTHTVRVGTYRLDFTGPGIVLAASGVLTIAVAIFAGRQVGGLRGEFVRGFIGRLLRKPRQQLIESESAFPGVFFTVVGPDDAATGRYFDALEAHVQSAGWLVYTDHIPVGAKDPDDSESDALRALAEMSDVAVHRLQPALEAGKVVICRDYLDAIVIRYAAHARLDEQRLLRMAKWSTDGLKPDLTILVDPFCRPGDLATGSPGGGQEGSEPAEGADDLHSKDGSKGADGSASGSAAADGAEPDAKPPSEAFDGRVRAYQDLAASAPGRYLTVTPLEEKAVIPDDVIDEMARVMGTRSPRRVP